MRLVFWVVLLSVVPLSVDARSEGWVITARDTTADYFAVAMANGEIGVAVGREPFALGSVILGGSYEPGFGDDVSRILEGINPLGLTMAVDGHRFDPSEVRPQHQSVDMRRAVHTNRFSTDGVTVVYRIRALRNMPYALMTEVEVTAERDAEVLFQTVIPFPESSPTPCGSRARSDVRTAAVLPYSALPAVTTAAATILWLRRLFFAVKGAKRSHRKA